MIYAKLDWYSVVLYNYSVNDILKRLSIFNEIFEELTASGYERSQGFSSVFVFSYAGISIELKFDDYLSTNPESLFSTPFKKIRLDISGSGLDYLRSFMVPDVVFTDSTFWGLNQRDYNITRCDFAFDFVNYKGDFLDNVLYWIKDNERSGKLSKFDSRLRVGRKSGIQYSYRCGSGQETLYLGSPRGDKMVRIYDKLLEQTDNGVFKHGRDPRFDKEESINSWFRIELQSRRKCATEYLYGCYGDISTVLRCIFNDYLIRDDSGVPLSCMVDLYQWDSLPEIHKITDFMESRTTVIERSHSYITGQAFRSCVMFLLRYGVSTFIDELNLCIMKCSTLSSNSETRRFLAFRNNLARMCVEEGLSVDNLPGRLKINDSDLYLINGGNLTPADLFKKVRENN